MLTEEASCSECKLELIRRRWTEILLIWLNKCVHPKAEVKQLNLRSLVEIINRYKHDICANDFDRAMLCTDDLEPFITYKYPILRLRVIEDDDIWKKLYIMTSVLLYHCCINCVAGVVTGDICHKLQKVEQEMILTFCEKLNSMEITMNNVEGAIKDACDPIDETHPKPPKLSSDPNPLLKTKESKSTLIATCGVTDIKKRRDSLIKFKSSVTVLPSCVDTSYSKLSLQPNDSSTSASDYTIMSASCKPNNSLDRTTASESNDLAFYNTVKITGLNERHKNETTQENMQQDSIGITGPNCKPDCACVRCSTTGPCCGDPGSSLQCDQELSTKEKKKNTGKDVPVRFSWFIYFSLVFGIAFVAAVVILITYYNIENAENPEPEIRIGRRMFDEASAYNPNWGWECKRALCEKVFKPIIRRDLYSSLSQCILMCMGPQLWPYPIGYTHFSKTIVTIETSKLEYRFQSIPSETVHRYLAEAFKLFLGELAKLERNELRSKTNSQYGKIKKIYIQIDVESDTDPRLRLDTDESYVVKIETLEKLVKITVASASFCGVRHGLETLTQLILLDQSNGYLITLSNAEVKDGPSYRYRGLMIDTARNYIPIPDLLRTLDAMATCKLNTFHWRISDATSFPLLLPDLPNVFEYGAYNRKMVYTKNNVKTITNRAAIRGVRVLIEVAAPGPVGRAWSWFDEAICLKKNDNITCDNILCLRLDMTKAVFDALQYIYTEIIDLTACDDVFHMSDSLFSLSNCYYLIEQRGGFLEKALDRLRLANKGFLPKLPIVWYTGHLTKELEAKTWERLGVQLNDWKLQSTGQRLKKFKVIHSSKWELSCGMHKQRCSKYRSWQEMYSWKSWRSIDVFSIEGGEAVLWTDLVDSGNLDYHLWPRVAAVAERLWSDVVANATPNGLAYVRLDSHRWRLLHRGVQAQPIWPVWCSFNPGPCIAKLQH